MVIPMSILRRLAAATCSGAILMTAVSLPVTPAHADDILGQIETQVAGIVNRTTGGVVTIEDLRGIELDDQQKQAMSNRHRGLRHTMTEALDRLADADVQIAVLKSAVKSGSVLADAVKARNSIAAELDTLKAEVAKSSDAAILNVFIYSGHLRALTEKRNHLEEEINQLGKTVRPTAPRMAPLLATRTAMNNQIAEVQTRLAADQQKLAADSSMRTDIPKAGTGFSIGGGYFVTTADVLDGMSEPVVITTDGSRVRSKIVGLDNETNIGLLHLEGVGAELPSLVFGDSNTVAVGHFAVCIGNQSGTQNAVSLDTVSAIRSDGMFSGRRFYPRLLQIAGAIAPGNSGAPLMNSRGEVIGVVVAVPVSDWQAPSYSTFVLPHPPGQPAGPLTVRDHVAGGPRGDQGATSYFRPGVTGAGYAMPINCARPIIEDMRSGKPVQHCWIGISVSAQVVPNYTITRLDLNRTVTVNGVFPNSPALKVGVQKGDEIISINGRPIREDLDVRIESMLARPGDPITIVLMRPAGQKSETITLHATADLRPPPPPRPTQPKTP